MSAEYLERGFTYEITHYIKRLPAVCKKLSFVRLDNDKAKSEKMMQQILTDIIKCFMLNEYEIIHYVKYLKNFQLDDKTFYYTISFIALATKMLMNE